jgi:predicted Fe-Mo cluster-binding NifX family protein
MKVAVSATGKDLESQLDPRFGRCANFVIVETEGMAFESIGNDSASLGGGAGIAAAQSVASKGVKAVLTGHCGPNAMQALSAAGIEVYVGLSGTVREVVETYKTGALNSTIEPNVASHFGMGQGSTGTNMSSGGGMGGQGGQGMGRGRGLGRGRGGGMGRGMGMGRGAGRTNRE